MSRIAEPDLSRAALARRQELPATIALVLIVGGASSAILGEALAIAWAGLVGLALMAESALFAEADRREGVLAGAMRWALPAGVLAASALFTSLPIALWANGPEAAAAAMALFVLSIIRQIRTEAPVLAAIGAAPGAVALTLTPLVHAALTDAPDWNAAVVAAASGGALAVYAAVARFQPRLGVLGRRDERPQEG